MLCCCATVRLLIFVFSQNTKRPCWLSVTEAIVPHVGESEWACKASLGWLVQIVLQFRRWLEFSRQSRDNKGEICSRLTVNSVGLDYMYWYQQIVLCSSCNCQISGF